MQRVVRSTFVGLVALASLTACGDKVTNVQQSQPSTNVVREVIVSPQTANLNVGDVIALAASVNADAGVTDRTVAWSTSNAAVATVDAVSGSVKAITAGSATITATSNADKNVKGAALITVGAGSNATVTISTINQTTAAGSVPANLGNVANQLDVTLNVDPGTQKLAGVDLIMNCAAANGNSGKDTVVQTQNLASSDIATAEAAAAPVTLSFNTGAFTAATGVPAFFNGTCTLRAQARTSGGTTVASTSTTITLNNADVVIGGISSTKNAADNAGLSWHGGDVTVTTTPVFYSGRVAASTVVSFEGKSQTVTGAGTKTVTFVDGNDPGNAAPAANDIDGVTDLGATPTIVVLDAAGNNFTTNPCGNQICSSTSVLANAPAPITTGAGGNNPFRLDTRAPAPGIFLLANNPDQGTTVNGYVGTAFRFAADSAAGYRGPDATAGNQTRNLDATSGTNGVDKVTVVFQSGTSATGTFTTLTGTSGLAETAVGNAVILRMITTDALGNADTSFAGPAPAPFRAGTVPAGARFGVDLTAPTQTLAATSNAVDGDAFSLTTLNHFDFTITDNLSGTGLVYVAQTRNWNGLTGTQTAADGRTYTNTGAAGTFLSSQAVTDKSPCTIGRYNISQAASGTGAVPAFDNTGAAVGFCTPVPYTIAGGVLENAAQGVNGGYFKTTVAASDEAGNRAPTFTATAYESNSAPVVNNIDLPGSITGNTTASFPAAVTENVATSAGDITSSWIQLDYNAGGTITFQYPVTTGPGVAFDNVLTKTATVTPTIANFAKSLVVSAGAAPVVAAANNATTIRVFAADAAIVAGSGAPNSGFLQTTLAPSVQLVAGSSSTFAAQFTAGFHDSLAVATPNAVSVSVGGTTTVAAVATGTTGIFNNPFSGGAVTFWYKLSTDPAAGPWFFIASTSTGVTTDTGAGNGRSWIFSTPFVMPSKTPDGRAVPAGTILNIRAVGVNTAGDAVTTPGTAAITITP